MSKIISCDIETTGTNSNEDQILQIAMVVFDSKDKITPVKDLPFIDLIIKHKKIIGNPTALFMNANLIKILSENKDNRIVNKDEAEMILGGFLNDFYYYDNLDSFQKPPLLFLGKNFNRFDWNFIWNYFSSYEKNDYLCFPSLGNCRVSSRSIDIGQRFFNPETDEYPPSTQECINRSKNITIDFEHDALNDARLMIELFRNTY